MVVQMEQQINQNSQSSFGDQNEENESSSVEIEENVVKFLDSMDNYLILTNSLSSTLREVEISIFDLVLFHLLRMNWENLTHFKLCALTIAFWY